MMRYFSWVLAAVALVGASTAQARLLEPQHEGFFLRFQAGPGYLRTNFADEFGTRGGSGTLGVAIGGTIARNLILFGEVVSQSSPSPVYEEGGRSVIAEELTIGYSGVGAGLAYYLPANFYVSGSLLFSQVTAEIDGWRGKSRLGTGTRLSVGKEWWVSSDWGLGLAVVGDFASVKDFDPNGSTIGIGGLSLAFSATLN